MPLVADTIPLLEDLAPVWVKAFAERGVHTTVSLALWREDLAQPTPERVRMLERWAAGQARITDLARQLAVPHSRVQAQLTDTALRLIAPHLEDLSRWVRARGSGVGDASIAALSGTSAIVVALALDGRPATAGPGGEVIAEAYRHWRGGAPRAEVARALGIPLPRLTKQLRSGESVLEPRRLVARDLRERFGWTTSAQSLYIRKGLLPTADGVDGTSRWWWESSIDEWERQHELHWCRRCRHAFVTTVGLKEHGTRIHG